MKSQNSKVKSQNHKSKGKRIFKCFNFLLVVLTFAFLLFSLKSFADTVYLKDGISEKGLIVEEYYDRFIFSTPDGEKEIPKSRIDEIFFDEPYQNDLYMGNKFLASGDFERAMQFYQLALQLNPDYRDAQDAIKGLEDARWRFKKDWRYTEMRALLRGQLGLELKKSGGKIVISKAYDDIAGSTAKAAAAGDIIVSCWERPLTYAGLKNASRLLLGLPNTVLKLVIERAIKVNVVPGFRLSAPVLIDMDYDGAVVREIKRESPLYGSGLKAGDLIVKINGEATRYMKLAQVRKQIFNLSRANVVTVRRDIFLTRKKREAAGIKNAMWAWHSKELLLNESAKKEFLAFCNKKNIGVVFLQLQYQFLPFNGQMVCRILYEHRLREFLKDAHAGGVDIHSLDGSPSFCLDSGHPLVLAQLKAILEFNKNGPVTERFDGVHYDNEPYLLAGFLLSRNNEIIDQYLALNRKCRELIDSSQVKLDYGVDVPFWFDTLDSLDKRLVDICDNVGIMDYRNFASGPDGIINYALGVIKYASAVKKKIFVGVETSKYENPEVYIVSAPSKAGFDKYISKEANKAIAQNSLFEGFPIRINVYEDSVYIGIVKSPGSETTAFDKAITKLEEQFGRIPKPADKKKLDNFVFDTINNIMENHELRDVEYQGYVSPDGKQCLMFKAREVMLEKLTFADMTEKELNDQLSEAKKAFEGYPGFAGFAIHHYKSYKAICDKKAD